MIHPKSSEFNQPSPIAAIAAISTTANIAVVEDEPIMRKEMSFLLQKKGFTVDAFETAAQFYRHLAVNHVDIAVLDIGLNGEDGLAICQHLRVHDQHIGIVFVTARSLHDERLTGLAAGADAYLVKPIDMVELLLILHRLAERVSPALAQGKANLPSGRWQLALNDWQIVTPNGITLRLSAREHLFLSLLVAAQGGTVTKQSLVESIYGKHLPDGDKRLEVLISRLRKKSRDVLGEMLPINTAHAVGYAFGALADIG